jgi:hypothetical protein
MDFIIHGGEATLQPNAGGLASAHYARHLRLKRRYAAPL